MNLSSFYFHDPIEITAASFCTAMVRFGRRKKAYPAAPLLCLDVARRARPQRGPYLYTSLYQPIPLPEGTTREEVWRDMPKGVPMVSAPRDGLTWESATLQRTPDSPVTAVQVTHDEHTQAFRLSHDENRNGNGNEDGALLFSYGQGVTPSYLLHLRSFSVTATARFVTVAPSRSAQEAEPSDAGTLDAQEAQQPYALELSQTFRKLAEAAAWIQLLTVAPSVTAAAMTGAPAVQQAQAVATSSVATDSTFDTTKKQEAKLPPASENLADMLDSLHASGLLSDPEWEEKKRQLAASDPTISD